jgi:hypothetical protein
MINTDETTEIRPENIELSELQDYIETLYNSFVRERAKTERIRIRKLYETAVKNYNTRAQKKIYTITIYQVWKIWK